MVVKGIVKSKGLWSPLYIYMKEIMEDHIFSLLLHLIPEKKDFKNQGGIKPMQKRQ